jgi:transposase
MGKKPQRRRSFTPEFKAEIVELCQRGDRLVGQVARDFDLTETAVREWVKQAERDAGCRQDGGPTSSERGEELAQLRRENRRLREDVEILKWATASSPHRHRSGCGNASISCQDKPGKRTRRSLTYSPRLSELLAGEHGRVIAGAGVGLNAPWRRLARPPGAAASAQPSAHPVRHGEC